MFILFDEECQNEVDHVKLFEAVNIPKVGVTEPSRAERPDRPPLTALTALPQGKRSTPKQVMIFSNTTSF